MYLKWFGAALIMGSCSLTGFRVASAHRKETIVLKQLIMILDYMECELRYRLTPLPELCNAVAEKASGALRNILKSLSSRLLERSSTDAERCMRDVLHPFDTFPEIGKEMMMLFGSSMGVFDLDGQVQAIQAVKQECHRQLSVRQENQVLRLRGYQTLWICAGAALAVIFV